MNSSKTNSHVQLPAGIRPGEIITSSDPAFLTAEIISSGQGVLTSTGAIMADTGKFTGRAPDDKYIVEDELSRDTVWWGDVNRPIGEDTFYRVLANMSDYLNGKKVYVQDVFACADEKHRIGVRVITTSAMHSLFANNMFIRPKATELENFKADYTVICVPEYTLDPAVEGTRSPNFAMLNLSRKMVIIGGTGYTGEIKKSIFSILNYTLPKVGVLSMHCSANIGNNGEAAVFFGLSGTGKTTLSADPERNLIGDDEHGWSDEGLFNFEGGCYAKVINLSKENEPQIWNAIKDGSLVENTRFFPGTNVVDYSDGSVTANTRVSYPLHFISNAVIPSKASHPINIFFLTADAWGVLPPISRLNKEQAMFHFVSGYTARVAGTEVGVTEPKSVFSACFGAPFLPLHPLEYAKLLGDKMQKHEVNVWLVNTGWTGGAYGEGRRISIPYTRALITAALNGELAKCSYTEDPIFGLHIPNEVPGVPAEILNPRNTWANKENYDKKANGLADAFLKNIEKYNDGRIDIMSGAPKRRAEKVAV